jgi:serine protease AprX
MNFSITRKLLVLFFFFCLVCTATFAQQYPKYVVVFKNKNNNPYSLNKPKEYLSPRSIQRRVKYEIKLDSSDLPVTPSYVSQVLAQGAVTYLSQSKWLNQILIYTTSTATVNAIKNLPFVASVNPVGPSATAKTKPRIDKFDEKVEKINTTPATNEKTAANLYNYGNSYGQVHIHNGEFLHNKGFTGKGIMISVLDAGFYRYKTTKAFDSARADNRILGEKDFVDFDGSANEDNDHGELCLSIIASNVPGVMVGTAPEASFWLLRSENVNSEFPIEEHNWAAAAEFADSVGTDMISSSLGYFQFDDAQFNHTYNDIYKNTTMSSRAATYASRKGILVTNSAGNEGGSSWKYIIFPSDADSVCAVAATNVNGNIAYFSSYGYPGEVKPNISSVGDGTSVYAWYGVSSGSGTSFSNPNINGLIACLWQAFPEFNNITILRAVYKSGDRYKTPDNRFGYGTPNMQKAYNLLMKLRNQKKFGDKWLIAGSAAFNNELSFTLVGQEDKTVSINLLDENKKVVAKRMFTTQTGEIYEHVFNGLHDVKPGNYTLQYSDGETTTEIAVSKAAAKN